jgi:hypothetical protein
MDKLTGWKEQMAQLEASLRPIGTRPVEITDLKRRVENPPPFDPAGEAGVKAQAEQLLVDLIHEYPISDPETREHIRKLFDTHRNFSWAATLPDEPTTETAFRSHLILFSIKDQEQDPRDAILLLRYLCEKAKSAGINIGPILEEVADLSSDLKKYGGASTRSLLLGSIPKPIG